MTRIAMIGGGPKCLFALLELNDALTKDQRIPVQVDVYDPYPPGAGRVWNTGQPRELLLNVNSRIIDASSTLCSQSFDEWRAVNGGNAGEKNFPPRALVGEYLSEQFARLIEDGKLNLEHRLSVVTEVVRHGSQWEVSTAQGAELYDEVVIATGHGLAGYRSEVMLDGALSAAQLTVECEADAMGKVQPGNNVLIRGAALTAYDVVLTLTDGRGGGWEPVTRDGLSSLRYLPSGKEPAHITMTSRTNIPMSPKPQSIPANLHEVLDEFRTQIRQWGAANAAQSTKANEQPEADLEGLWQILLACALRCAQRSGIRASVTELFITVFAGQSEAMSAIASPAEKLRASLRANRGVDPATHEWIWAIVWSGLYAQLVQALSRIQWTVGDRERFNRLAANLERMAFGPPEPTALKLLALFDAGILHQEPSADAAPADAIMIDAVTAPAGALSGPVPDGIPTHSLFSSLLANQEILIRHAERGLLTDTDGTCLNARGERNESLAALGRPTEDPTLGHDTLNRTLHPEYRVWAQRIATKITSASQKVAL
ncbi:FAD/NAD(P)-binding protein [Glutamicibacter arilaitensis]|uniref:FAD/NAD(P)-binding protein n=1 Tax=Glutamicibacter arilaitensis TaxID=256701 RepID=UPI00384F805B